MCRALALAAWFALLASLSVGCAAAGERVEQLRDSAADLRPGEDEASSTPADDDGFCLALTRTVTAVASGSPATAEEAAEEALALAPEALADTTWETTDALRSAREDGDDLSAEHVDEALARLVDAARDVCSP